MSNRRLSRRTAMTYIRRDGMLVRNAASIVEALYSHYRARGYLCLHELRPGTGFTAAGNAGGIDFWCMHQWPSKRLARIAFEIKVSRSDFLREMKAPQKQKFALAYSNQFYFVTPPNLVTRRDLRPEAGLIEVAADGTLREVLKAPWRESRPPSWTFMAAVMRRLIREQGAQEVR